MIDKSLVKLLQGLIFLVVRLRKLPAMTGTVIMVKM